MSTCVSMRACVHYVFVRGPRLGSTRRFNDSCAFNHHIDSYSALLRLTCLLFALRILKFYVVFMFFECSTFFRICFICLFEIGF